MIWFSLLMGVLLLSVFLKPGAAGKPQAQLPLVMLFAPFLMGTTLRWLVLPRIKMLMKALPIFIAGLAMCEATAILGIFMGGENRDLLVGLGALGIIQYVPLFAAKLK